jgi:hypothetical protein
MCGVEPGDGGKENGKDVQGSASGSWSTCVVRVLAVPPSDVLALRWLRAAGCCKLWSRFPQVAL